jgi:hypothetical protein
MTTDTTHECPAPGCKARVRRDMLACPPHWFLLGPELRARIWKAWRAQNWGEHSRALSEALETYEERLGGQHDRSN